jgi:hypothetical protein
MLIKEWHIALQQELNKINSALYDVLLPQEVDMAFNKNIEMFINQRYDNKSNRKQEGFEQSQKRTDDLRSLVRVMTGPGLLGFTFNNSFSYDERSLFVLPQDYRFKVAARIKSSTKGCSSSFSPVTTNITYYIYGFDLSVITNYASFYIKDPAGNKIFTENIGLGNYTTDDFDTFKDIVLDETVANYKTTNVMFFETFLTYTKKNHILFVTTTPSTSFKYYNGTSEISINLLTSTIEKTYAPQGTSNTSSDKVVTHDTIYAMQADPFNKTTEDFPLSLFENNLYYTYYDKNNFVVSNIEMTYIRKPKTVSYYANISCDLPEHTHQEIISMTAQYFLEEFEAARQQTHKETVLTTE